MQKSMCAIQMQTEVKHCTNLQRDLFCRARSSVVLALLHSVEAVAAVVAFQLWATERLEGFRQPVLEY